MKDNFSYSTDIPLTIKSYDDDNVNIVYRSGWELSFPYEFFIHNLGFCLYSPFLKAIMHPQAKFVGVPEPTFDED